MPKPQTSINSNLEDGIKTVKNLKNQLPESAEDAQKILGQEFIREARRKMRANGSVETQTGINSFRTEHTQDKTLVYGADYLLSLDRGTTPHYPDANNYRFIQWARSNEFTRQQLVETISIQGTRPHPWVEYSTSQIRAAAPKRVNFEVKEAVRKSLKQRA